MIDERYKERVDSDVTIFDYDLSLVIEIFSNAEVLSKNRTREAGEKLRELDSNDHSLDDSQKKMHGECMETIMNFGLHFDHITLHSLFVTSFSFFEHYFDRIAEAMEQSSDSRIKIKDIAKRNNDIDQNRRYLNLVHDLKSASLDTKLWQMILMFQKIRNIIVHSQNMFGEKYGKERVSITAFLRKFKVHMIRDFGFQITDKTFLEEFRQVVVAYFLELHKEIDSMR